MKPSTIILSRERTKIEVGRSTSARSLRDPVGGPFVSDGFQLQQGVRNPISEVRPELLFKLTYLNLFTWIQIVQKAYQTGTQKIRASSCGS